MKFYTHSNGEKTAYHTQDGDGIGVFYLPVYGSYMEAERAVRYKEIFAAEGIPFTGLDWQGFGQSSGEPEVRGITRHWASQALDIFDNCTTGKQIVLGVSMGGWLAVLLAQLRPERVAGVVGICPGFGVNLGPKSSELYGVYRVCDLDNTAGFDFDVDTDGGFTHVTQNIEGVKCPVRLYHAYTDERVKWQSSKSLFEHLPEDCDATLFYTRSGDHALKRDMDYQKTLEFIKELREIKH